MISPSLAEGCGVILAMGQEAKRALRVKYITAFILNPWGICKTDFSSEYSGSQRCLQSWFRARGTFCCSSPVTFLLANKPKRIRSIALANSPVFKQETITASSGWMPQPSSAPRGRRQLCPSPSSWALSDHICTNCAFMYPRWEGMGEVFVGFACFWQLPSSPNQKSYGFPQKREPVSHLPHGSETSELIKPSLIH